MINLSKLRVSFEKNCRKIKDEDVFRAAKDLLLGYRIKNRKRVVKFSSRLKMAKSRGGKSWSAD